MYLGLFELNSTLKAALPIEVANTPIDPAVNPTYRVYEGDQLIASGTGSLTPLDTGTVTGASNTTPIVITSVAHGLVTGNVVKIKNVGGNTAANGTFSITRIDADTFSLDSSVGNSAYTSGGTWHVCGLYLLNVALLPGSGFEVGKTYQVLVNWINAGTFAKIFYFSVT